MDNDIEYQYYADEAHCEEVPIAPLIPALASCQSTGFYLNTNFYVVDDSFADNDYKYIKNESIIYL